MADVYTPMSFDLIRRIDKRCIRFHATRDDMIKYCVQIALPILDALSSEEKHKLMRAFENNQALIETPVSTSDTEF